MLSHVRSALSGRLINTPVRRDGSCVVIDFSRDTVDVVPAFYKGQHQSNWPLYSIPGRSGDWIETSPAYQAKFISDRDREAGGKLRGLATLMKLWRHCRTPSIDLSSFFLEMLLAETRLANGPRTYPALVAELLALLVQRGGRSLRDPTGTHGPIDMSKTDFQRQRTNAAIEASLMHARRAVQAANSYGGTAEAQRQWRLVFNDRVSF
jgi:hypothetical protein